MTSCLSTFLYSQFCCCVYLWMSTLLVMMRYALILITFTEIHVFTDYISLILFYFFNFFQFSEVFTIKVTFFHTAENLYSIAFILISLVTWCVSTAWLSAARRHSPGSKPRTTFVAVCWTTYLSRNNTQTAIYSDVLTLVALWRLYEWKGLFLDQGIVPGCSKHCFIDFPRDRDKHNPPALSSVVIIF